MDGTARRLRFLTQVTARQLASKLLFVFVQTLRYAKIGTNSTLCVTGSCRSVDSVCQPNNDNMSTSGMHWNDTRSRTTGLDEMRHLLTQQRMWQKWI
jgi:hypothetical protein